MIIFEILINDKTYAFVQTRIEAETIQELLYNYLEVENIEYIKIMEVKSVKHYALIDERNQDTYIYKFESETEAEHEASRHWHKLTNSERKERKQFELVYFENEQNFDEHGEYQRTIIDFLEKQPYLYNQFDCTTLNYEDAKNYYSDIIKNSLDIYDLCNQLNKLNISDCGDCFEIRNAYIE